jgi:hypothetical protein
MADQFDQAQEIDALMRSSAIAQQAKKAAASPKLEAIGECHNPLCGEPFEGDDIAKLFCGPKCAAEHARRSK